MSELNPHQMRRDMLWLTGITLVLVVVVAALMQTPGYMDADYYYAGALRLRQGYGLTEPYLWNYLSALDTLPVPSHIYWMPLTSLLAAASMAVFGASFRAAQLPFILIVAGLPALTVYTARQFTASRRVRWLAGLLAGVGGFYFVRWPTTDSFGLYALIGALFFLTLARGLTSGDSGDGVPGLRCLLAAGVLAGAAHLTRADGLLLAGVGGLMVLFNWRRYGWDWAIRAVLALLASYLLLMGPWMARNLAVLGTPLAPGGTQAMLLTGYNDLFNYPNDLTVERFLAQGWPVIVSQRLEALGQNLVSVLAVQGLVFLLPFIGVGMWHGRGQPVVQAVVLYELALLAAMSLVFPFQGARGGFFHSGAAVHVPFMVLGVLGLDASIDWIAARRPNWNAGQAKWVFGGGMVLLAGMLSGVTGVRSLANWNAVLPLQDEVDGWLAAHPEFAGADGVITLATNNPPGWYVATGAPGVFVPARVDDLLAVAADFEVDLVLLEAGHPAALELAESPVEQLVEVARFELPGGDDLLVLAVGQ